MEAPIRKGYYVKPLQQSRKPLLDGNTLAV
jgi:hypothetical protein